MISMQQLEELENRVVKALQLIGDLRTENSKLESDNESMKTEIEEARHRVRESRMVLLLKAEVLGVSAPRSCCPHAGPAACPLCASDWLVAALTHASRSAVPVRRRPAVG